MLSSILEKYTTRKSETDLNLIVQIEELIDFQLPKDYVEFISNFRGFESFIGPEYVVLWDIEDLIEYNIDYGIIESLDNIVAIGSNGAGEYIALDKHGLSSARIVLSPFIDLDSAYHIHIGDSFSDFLLRLERGIGWM